MKLVHACSVSKESGKMWLVLSERKNAKFPINHSFSLDSDPINADYVVLKTNLTKRFFLKKIDFLSVFGISYEQYREEKKQKIKDLASALAIIMRENGNN